MENFYRVRAFVETDKEEAVCKGKTVEAAMTAFAALTDPETYAAFGDYPILVAMVHQISFGESGPVFEDVTAQLDDRWARADYIDCLRFFPKK